MLGTSWCSFVTLLHSKTSGKMNANDINTHSTSCNMLVGSFISILWFMFCLFYDVWIPLKFKVFFSFFSPIFTKFQISILQFHILWWWGKCVKFIYRKHCTFCRAKLFVGTKFWLSNIASSKYHRPKYTQKLWKNRIITLENFPSFVWCDKITRNFTIQKYTRHIFTFRW